MTRQTLVCLKLQHQILCRTKPMITTLKIIILVFYLLTCDASALLRFLRDSKSSSKVPQLSSPPVDIGVTSREGNTIASDSKFAGKLIKPRRRQFFKGCHGLITCINPKDIQQEEQKTPLLLSPGTYERLSSSPTASTSSETSSIEDEAWLSLCQDTHLSAILGMVLPFES